MPAAATVPAAPAAPAAPKDATDNAALERGVAGLK
jgi:hypothetical protein